MNCRQANQMDMVDFLAELGYVPDKVRGNDYWYLSPLREERNASFKVNRTRNIWYDHGNGIGGTLVDFAMRYHNCDQSQALDKISGRFETIRNGSNVPDKLSPGAPNKLQVIETIHPIQNLILLEYLQQRKIDPGVAARFCKEILYENDGNRFRAIGFKNNAGGYELRSPQFKGSSSPKYVSWFNNRSSEVAVFEGFFDFLTWQTIHRVHPEGQTNFLVLNSLSFFTRSLLLQEKHERIHLYLDNDDYGKKCKLEIQKRSPGKVLDESRHYRDFKDLNEWFVQKPEEFNMRHSHRLRL